MLKGETASEIWWDRSATWAADQLVVQSGVRRSYFVTGVVWTANRATSDQKGRQSPLLSSFVYPTNLSGWVCAVC